MSYVPIVMPQLGESIAEATVIQILVQAGDRVVADQNLMEVETNKATTTVTSPCDGFIGKISALCHQSYPVGAVLGQIQVSEEVAQSQPSPNAEPVLARIVSPKIEAVVKEPAQVRSGVVDPTVRGLPVPANASGASYMSPRMKARMAELGLHAADLSGIAGSGAGGRVTIQDLEIFLSNLDKHRTTQASTMRVAVADAMRRSWTRPLATVALPVSLEALLAHRKTLDPKPGPALYLLRALAIALNENSAPAGRLVGNKLIHPVAIDLGFAVEVEDGVLVPVLRSVETRLLKDLVTRYNELVNLARQRKLPKEATGGSIATVTNFGTFGLTWATPIPLPEQTLVLGMGAGRIAPHWDEVQQRFIPAMEANLTLSFDHRVLDGGGAGRLLSRIAALMTQPELL